MLEKILDLPFVKINQEKEGIMQLPTKVFKWFKITQKCLSFLVLRKQTAQNYCQTYSLPAKLTFSRNYSLLHPKLHINRKHKSLYLKAFCIDTSNEVNSLVESIWNQSLEDTGADKKDELVRIFNFLVSHGCTAHEIKEKCSNYLIHMNCSYVKAIKIAELDSDILTLMPFMTLSLASLRKAAQQAREDKYEIEGFSNRLSYLSHHLETGLEDLIPALTKHSSLLTVKFSRLHHKMILLKNAEIIPKDLVKDLWIFNYNEQLLTTRISAAEEAGVKLKPWMLRCSGNFFISMLKKYSETQRILDGQDVITYLCKKLDCNRDYIEYMMERNTQLRSVNIPKVEKIIQFLFEKGYTPQEIRLFPRVFCSKVETLSKRLEQYLQIRSTLPPIPQLCIANKNFKRKLDKNSKQ